MMVIILISGISSWREYSWVITGFITTPGCPHFTQCSGGDVGNMEDFEEFQDYDEF
jgi:hypothetical protein